MQADLPHTLYKSLRGKEKGETKKNYTVNPHDPAFERQKEVVERALARQKAKYEGKTPYRMDELFR